MFRRLLAMPLIGLFLMPVVRTAAEGDRPQRIAGNKAETAAKRLDEALRKTAKPGPLKVTPDLKKAVGLAARDRGGLVIPDAKLSAETLKKIDREIVPIGVLYALGVTVVGDEPVPAEQHQLVEVTQDGRTMTAAVLHLAATRVAGRLALLVYAKDSRPLLITTLHDANEASEYPIDLEARGAGDDRATLTLKILGAYRAHLTLAQAN
jgi:hypothetical protein